MVLTWVCTHYKNSCMYSRFVYFSDVHYTSVKTRKRSETSLLGTSHGFDHINFATPRCGRALTHTHTLSSIVYSLICSLYIRLVCLYLCFLPHQCKFLNGKGKNSPQGLPVSFRAILWDSLELGIYHPWPGVGGCSLDGQGVDLGFVLLRTISLELGLTNFFCKGSDRKIVQLRAPWSFYCDSSTLLL